MSERFPINEANPDFVHELKDNIHKIHGDILTWEWKNQENALFGPYPALLHSPTITPTFWEMARVTTDPNSVKPKNRELAILGLLSVVRAPFVRYSHGLIALHKEGITEEQYETGLKGSTPVGLSEEEGAAYRLGRTLAELKGPMDDETWDDAVGKLGKREVLGVAHIVGAYIYIAMLSNINGQDSRFP